MDLGKYKTKLIATLLFGTGFGIALHDYCHTLWEIGKYKEILSFQGGYIGFVLIILAWIILNLEIFLKKLEKD